MFSLTKWIASIVLLFVIVSALHAQAPFLKARSEQQRCEALTKWIAHMEANSRGRKLDSLPMGRLEVVVATAFLDDVFIPVIGKPYAQLSNGDRRALRDGLRSCFRQPWITVGLAQPFDDRTGPLDRQRWERAIAAAKPLPTPSATPSGRSQPGSPTAPGRAAGGEQEIPELGLRVIAQDTIIRDRIFPLPRITAIQEGSPAYFAELRPGDIIAVAGGQNWPHTTTLATLAKGALREQAALQLQIKDGERNGVPVYRRVNVPAEEPNAVGLSTGEWLRVAPTPEQLAQARAAAAVALKAARTKALETVTLSNPCQLNNNQIQVIARPINRLTYRAKSNDPPIESEMRIVAARACSKIKYGELPEFEALLLAIVTRKIDVCQYAPGQDFQAILREIRDWKSVEEYWSSVDILIDRFLAAATPQQKACFFRYLRVGL